MPSFVKRGLSVSNVFIAADWKNVEGRLTAYFSGDETLQEMLDNELVGGHSVHAITAGLLYNIDPGDAHKHTINLQGNSVSAYKGGKRLRHAWHYGLKPKNMSDQFWITRKKAEEYNDKLSEMHPGVVAWWKELGDEVFGVHHYVCPRCNQSQSTGGNCGACEGKPGRYVPTVRWEGWEREPTRVLYTPFGRRRIYLGRRAQSMNALISQKPQGSGASMWYRRLAELHKLEGAPPGTLVFTGSYEGLTEVDPGATMINTGTYDSFLAQTPAGNVESVIQWLAGIMEAPWPQLEGLRIPVDVKIGDNWREKDGRNERGLESVSYAPFSAGDLAK